MGTNFTAEFNKVFGNSCSPTTDWIKPNKKWVMN